MCGICGAFGKLKGDENIRGMMSTLTHRGPDGAGQYSDPNCVLGHQRLAILDLSDAGSQPMHNEDSTVWSIVNGEIYNYKTLRTLLSDHGHKFTSNCDSEVLVHAYEHFGDDFVVRLRGMFALALYDRSKQKIILARDPAGKKPMYYHQSNGKLTFASEIKALFEAGVSKAVNYDATPSWLKYQYSIRDGTLFKGVHKLPAGCLLVWECGRIEVKRYWKLPEKSNVANGVEAVEHLDELLEESVKLRLQSDVPVGSFLSGGLDSSLMTALYRKLSSGDIHTFTVTFDHFSEAKYAKEVSQHLATIHHEVPINAGMVARDVGHVTWHHDEPLGDAAVLCNYYMAKEAKKYVTVALAGEGGDEVFGGYPWYRYAEMLGGISRVPGRQIIGRILSPDVTNRWYRLQRYAGLFDSKSLDNSLLYATTATSRRSVEWLTGWECQDNYVDCRVEGVYNRMLALDFLNLLPEKFLMKADKGTMSWAIEERLPLLDVKVVEYAFSLDPDLKKDKWVLRRVAEKLLPEGIARRPKQGFGTPIAQWLREKPLADMVLDRVAEGVLLREVCKPKALGKVVKYIRESRGQGSRVMAADPMNVVWGLFALQVWHDIWFGRG